MITIIGAGIAGLSLGWELAASGADVTILEKNKIANGASGAAGAWLEPRPGGGKLRALEWAALGKWPQYAAKLEQESGIAFGFRNDGVVHVATLENHNKLQVLAEFHSESSSNLKWYGAKALQELEPNLSPKVIAGLYFPRACHLDARQVCFALAEVFKKCGGRLLENTAARRISQSRDSIFIDTGNGGRLTTKKLVVAAAHGTNSIGGLPGDIPLSKAVRGVMLELRTNSDTPLIRRPLKTADNIILPLSGGRLLVGSSHEDDKEELIVCEHIVEQILTETTKFVPEIVNLKIVEKRVGIRSLVGDGLLRLGHSRENPDIYYSMSHAGAGFLRAPVIAEELAGIILDPDFTPRWIRPFLVW